jgi:hypothetical protein
MKTTLPYLMLVTLAIMLSACEEDEPKTVPEVATSAITDVTPTAATGGGEITKNGNAEITESGLVYSNTNITPTISDSKMVATVTDGVFTVSLAGLSSGTTYYARAYATNSVGTGYGDVVEFATGNAAPVATDVSVTGTVEVNRTLTATFAYSDAEDDAENGSTFQWYKADNDSGTGEAAIAGATESTYHLEDADEFKYIRVAVVPKSSTGNITGVEVRSPYVGPVAVRTTVTFTYNGAEVIYEILTSATTGRKWLDRNLGAPNAPNAYNDYANYGDVFQWGRGADGHQLVNRGEAGTTSVNGTTTTLSTSDTPGNSHYIISSGGTGDWRDPQNNNLWQGVSGINNPCPSGWRLPTREEWLAENLGLLPDAYTKLKITAGGYREGTNGSFANTTDRGQYWTMSLPATNTARMFRFRNDLGEAGLASIAVRSQGMSCRCIKD